jgi:TonB family protein
MFSTLLESRRVRRGSPAHGAVSFLVHGVLTMGAVLASGVGARLASGPATTERVAAYVPLHFLRATVATREASGHPAASDVAPGRLKARRLVAPAEVRPVLLEVPSFDVPVVILTDLALDDAIALGSLPIEPEDFALPSGYRGLRDAISRASVPHGSGPFREWEVERVAVPLADNPVPDYPESLRRAQIEGQVLVSFVVDTTGAAVPTSARVLGSSHELFSRAVRAVLPRLHFVPARSAGAKVEMLVEQPFRFVLR